MDIHSKHAKSNSEVFWLQSVIAITASMQPELGRIIYAGSKFLHLIQFRSAKEGLCHSVENQPGSNLDGLVRFWPNVSGPEASWCARIIEPWSDKNQSAHYQFPTFRLGCIFPQAPCNIVCKTSTDMIWFWLIVLGLGRMDTVQS